MMLQIPFSGPLRRYFLLGTVTCFASLAQVQLPDRPNQDPLNARIEQETKSITTLIQVLNSSNLLFTPYLPQLLQVANRWIFATNQMIDEVNKTNSIAEKYIPNTTLAINSLTTNLKDGVERITDSISNVLDTISISNMAKLTATVSVIATSTVLVTYWLLYAMRSGLIACFSDDSKKT